MNYLEMVVFHTVVKSKTQEEKWEQYSVVTGQIQQIYVYNIYIYN